jgi:hypothetical protein
MEIFRQWWVYEPYESKPPGSVNRQTWTTRQSDLGYAVLRGRNHMLRRYWRFRSIVRDSPLELAYRSALIEEAESMLD